MHPQDQKFASGTSAQAGPEFGAPEPRDDDIVMAEVIDESASDGGIADVGSADGGIADEERDAADESVAGGQNPVATSAGPILGQQWHDIQSMFVDDPRAAVHQAAEAADAAIAALAADLRREMSELAEPDESGQNTELLRIALQRCRVLWHGAQDLAASSMPRAR